MAKCELFGYEPIIDISKKEKAPVFKKERIRVDILSNRIYGGLTENNELKDAISWLRGIYKNIPKEYRTKAKLELDVDDYACQLTIYYYREETDVEMGQRHLQHEQKISNIVNHERALYFRLKKKYEEKP